MARSALLLAATLLLLPAGALAQSAEVADDFRDARWAENLQARYDSAWSRRDWDAVRRIEDGVMRYCEKQRRDASQDLAKDTAEARRSAAELHQDRREGNYPQGSADADKLRHDRREARRDRAVLDRLAAMEREFGSLRGNIRKGAMVRKRQIIIDLVAMARDELRHDERKGP